MKNANLSRFFTLFFLTILFSGCATWKPFPVELYNENEHFKDDYKAAIQTLNNYKYTSTIFGERIPGRKAYKTTQKNHIKYDVKLPGVNDYSKPQNLELLGDTLLLDYITFGEDAFNYNYYSGELISETPYVKQYLVKPEKITKPYTLVEEIWITSKSEMNNYYMQKCDGDYVISFQKKRADFKSSVVVTEDVFKLYLGAIIKVFPSAKILKYKQPAMR